jgi:hypothetical protein
MIRKKDVKSKEKKKKIHRKRKKKGEKEKDMVGNNRSTTRK